MILFHRSDHFSIFNMFNNCIIQWSTCGSVKSTSEWVKDWSRTQLTKLISIKSLRSHDVPPWTEAVSDWKPATFLPSKHVQFGMWTQSKMSQPWWSVGSQESKPMREASALSSPSSDGERDHRGRPWWRTAQMRYWLVLTLCFDTSCHLCLETGMKDTNPPLKACSPSPSYWLYATMSA